MGGEESMAIFMALMVLLGLFLWAEHRNVPGRAVPIPNILAFLHAYDSAQRHHQVFDNGITVFWQQKDKAFLLHAETLVYEVDGEEGSRAVDVMLDCFPGRFAREHIDGKYLRLMASDALGKVSRQDLGATLDSVRREVALLYPKARVETGEDDTLTITYF